MNWKVYVYGRTPSLYLDTQPGDHVDLYKTAGSEIGGLLGTLVVPRPSRPDQFIVVHGSAVLVQS